MWIETKALNWEYLRQEWIWELLDLLQDLDLLNNKGKKIKNEIWEKQVKWKHHKDNNDGLENSWNTFTDYEKEFLIKEAQKWDMNERARLFVLSKI